MPRPVPVETLRAEHEDWMRRLVKAGEDWLTARAAGRSTDSIDALIREAQDNSRRLERRISRRKT